MKSHSAEVLAQCIGVIYEVFIVKKVCVPKPHDFHLLRLKQALGWVGLLSLLVAWKTAIVQQLSLISVNILVLSYLVSPNGGLYPVMDMAPPIMIMWAGAVWASSLAILGRCRSRYFHSSWFAFSGLTWSVLKDTFCRKNKSHFGSYMFFIFRSWQDLNTHRKFSSVSFIHLCRNESGFMKFVFFEKSFYSKPIPWP